MLKVLITIECDQCGDLLVDAVATKDSDAMTWKALASDLQARGADHGWDFFNDHRCPHCSGWTGEIFNTLQS